MKGYFNYFPDEWSIIGTVAMRWGLVEFVETAKNPREMVLIWAIKTILAVAENNDNQWDWTSYTCVYLPNSGIGSNIYHRPYYLHVVYL